MGSTLRSSSAVIPIYLVKEFSYCPRYAYYMAFTKGFSYITESMEIAIRDNGGDESSSDRIDLVVQGICKGGQVIREYAVSSRSLGIYGRVDYLCVLNREAIVIEVKGLSKISRKSLFKHHRHFLNQAVAYALAVEESLSKVVNYVIMLTGDGMVKVRITPALKNAVVRLIQEVRLMLETEELPRRIYDVRKCSYCFFRRLCRVS